MRVSFNVRDNITAHVNKMKRSLAGLPKEAYHEFVAVTPVRSGNARRRTQLSGQTIEANYAYAKRLDNGYSRQAPRGMTEPTEKFLKKRIKQILGNK